MEKWNEERFSITPAFCIVSAACLLLLPIEWLVGWGLAVGLHELAHLLIMRLCGVRILSVKLDVGGAMIRSDEMYLWQELLCALSGPLIGFIPVLLIRYIPFTGICALILSIFNLLPVYPLDGGRGLHCALKMLLHNNLADKLTMLVGRLTLITIVAAALIFALRYGVWLLTAAALSMLFLKFRGANPSCKEREVIVQ